jgi:hypothetical protein|tara:strand:+ start:299 stop:643 length:345 start_codon:yes stop_codon:yes gene_type:complete
MVEIPCPHCDEGIELEDDAFGLFDCPHCDEEFTREDDFDDRSVSSKYIRNLPMVNGVEVGLGILLIAVIVCPVIPVLFGIDDVHFLVWMFAAFIIFCIGIVVLFVGLWRYDDTS